MRYALHHADSAIISALITARKAPQNMRHILNEANNEQRLTKRHCYWYVYDNESYGRCCGAHLQVVWCVDDVTTTCAVHLPRSVKHKGSAAYSEKRRRCLRCIEL